MNKIQLLFKPKILFDILLNKMGRWIYSDRLFLAMKYRLRMGYWMDFKHPQTFNEKLQWLKLHDRKEIYTTMVDKFKAKEYVKSIIGEKYIVPTLGVWDKAEDIDFDSLPNQFVLKVTHDSGGICICRDKSTFDKDKAIRKLSKSLNRSYFYQNREWPYKNVERRIIAEMYLGENLQDYRVYCFSGQPKLIYSYTNMSDSDGSKPKPSHCDIFDCNWEPMPYHQKSTPSGKVNPPKQLSEMLDIAKKLAKEIPHLRVDFYECDKVYVGEMTFYAGSGMSEFHPQKWDKILGNWIILPGSVINNSETLGGVKY